MQDTPDCGGAMKGWGNMRKFPGEEGGTIALTRCSRRKCYQTQKQNAGGKGGVRRMEIETKGMTSFVLLPKKEPALNMPAAKAVGGKSEKIERHLGGGVLDFQTRWGQKKQSLLTECSIGNGRSKQLSRSIQTRGG